MTVCVFDHSSSHFYVKDGHDSIFRTHRLLIVTDYVNIHACTYGCGQKVWLVSNSNRITTMAAASSKPKTLIYNWVEEVKTHHYQFST